MEKGREQQGLGKEEGKAAGVGGGGILLLAMKQHFL